MLENLYTTKMSSSKKTLQKRFTKIRSKSGRLAKMMSVVMTFVLIAALGTATVVMAAVGSDGLEYWDENEIYFRDEIDFSINLYNQDVPKWLKDNISGNDDIINFKIKNYEVRRTNGMVNYGGFAEVSGGLGTYIFPIQVGIGLPDGIGSTLYSEIDLKKLFDNTNASYFTGLSLTTGGGSGHIVTSNLVANEYAAANNVKIGAGGDFEILFGFSKDNQLISTGCTFQHNVNRLYYLAADMTSIKMIGGIENRLNNEWLLAPAGCAFASFEKNYANRNIDEIQVNTISATKSGIALDVMNDLTGNYRVYADVYYGNGNKVIGTERESGYRKITIEWKDNVEVKTNDVCRIDLYIVDANSNRVIYRWQDYVTIQ